MRRSHRLALSVACALGLLVAAGTLATSALPDAAERALTRTREAADRARADALSVRATVNEDGERDGVAFEISLVLGADAGAPEARREQRTHPENAAPIVLDDPQIAFGAAVAVQGRDPDAPRDVELWRRVGARSARVAIGRSRSDGTLEFPALVLPAGDVTLVASPRGEGPDSPLASASVVASRDPSPPRLLDRAEDADAATLTLSIEPAEPSGAIVIARAAPDGIARLPVDASRTPLAVVIALVPGDTEVRIAQELPDGRRSAWRSVELESNSTAKENDDADAVAVAK